MSRGVDLGAEDYRYLHSTRGEPLRRLGWPDEARVAFARALDLAYGEAERRLLQRRVGDLGPGPS
ncbi:MAG: hypothetical protein ABJB55_09900 [Actinomycetota bacterium]